MVRNDVKGAGGGRKHDCWSDQGTCAFSINVDCWCLSRITTRLR